MLIGNYKSSEIKIIRTKITKVGMEIDNIKKRINLLGDSIREIDYANLFI